jgi:hypothetical protein
MLKKSKRFAYKPTKRTFMQKHIATRGRDFDSMFKVDVASFKPHDGQNKIRPVGRTSDEMDYWALPIHVHYGVGPEDQQYLCPRKHGGGKCPICEEYERARKLGKEEEAKELRPNSRYLCYLVDRKDEEKGIQIWSMPGMLDAELSKQTVDPDTGETLEIDNPSGGYDVFFTKEGTGIKTRYGGVKLARKPSDLDDDAVLEFAQKHPLPDILQVYDYDHILKEFEGSVERSDSDADEDEDGDRPRKKKKKQSKDEDLDEDVPYDEEEEDEDEDNSEEEDSDNEEEDEDTRRPRTRKGPRRKQSRRDDSDDDAEEDDDSTDDSDGEEITAKDLRKAKFATLKTIAKDNGVKWATLRALAEEEEWDDTKLKIKLRQKIAKALDIDLD